MRVPTRLATLTLVLLLAALPSAAPQKPASAPRPDPIDARLQALKQQAIADVDGMRDLTQQMIDQVFSFGELGFQEQETSRYLTGVLRRNGFTITEGVAAFRQRGSPRGDRASRSSRWARTSTDCRRRTRNPASRGTSRSSRARPAMAKATTPACR